MASTAEHDHRSHVRDDADLLESVEVLLRGLRFGSIEITVHEGRVAWIERREKTRLPPQRN